MRSGSLFLVSCLFPLAALAQTCNSVSLSPSSTSYGASGGSGSFSASGVPTNCNKVPASNNDWITISFGGGAANPSTIGYSVKSNPDPAPRTGSITVSGAVFNVQQAGNPAAVCNFTAWPGVVNVPASGTSGTITVTATASNCQRTATSGASWLTLSFGSSGTGNGTVGYSATENLSPDSRTATITIGNAAVTVTQAGANCGYSLFPSSRTVPAGGDSGSVALETACIWNAVSTAEWLVITSPSSGTGRATIGYSVQPNETGQSRAASLRVRTASFTVTQPGVPCSVTISSSSTSAPAGESSGIIQVTAAAGCNWTAVASDPWIRVTAGSGVVNYNVVSNPFPNSRAGTIAIANQTFRIIQAAANCPFSISPLSATIPAAATAGSIAITTSCAWTAASDAAWITVTGTSSGTGHAELRYSVTANLSGEARTGVIRIGSAAFTLTQAGAACRLTLEPARSRVPSLPGAGSFRVNGSAGCSWTPRAEASWITITGFASADGTGAVDYSYSANQDRAPRTAAITVGSAAFELTQDAAGPAITSNGVLNAASFRSGPLAPGEIITIFGSGLGPENGAVLRLVEDGLSLAKTLGGTRVLFDGAAAPMVYASSGQVSAIVPYATAGRSATRLQVDFEGALSNELSLPVAAASPALFSLNTSGAGPGAILNQDFSVNSAQNPAPIGSIVMLFATGEGVTTPAGLDGRLAAVPLPAPILPVRVWIGDLEARVTYAGAAPGLVAGVLQVNAEIPEGAASGDASVLLRVGEIESPPGVTVALR